MAGDWIKIEHALPGKPEVMRLAHLLGISDYEVVGHLVCFWSWVDQNLSGFCPVVFGTLSGIDRVAGRQGFAQAMIDVGWLRLENGAVEVPNYEEHLSQSAKARALESKRKRKQRADLSGKCPAVTGTKPGTREEKRREENNKNNVSSKEKTKKPKPNRAHSDASASFEAFWSAYPRKIGKGAARTEFDRQAASLAESTSQEIARAELTIVEAARKFATATWPANRPKHELTYCPHPKTWLHQERYQEEPEAWEPQKSSPPSKRYVPNYPDLE